jgi:TfoX/Sxy family transcriptional regulator of competence genes
MPHDPKQLQAVMESVTPDLELSFRPMFGGIMGYVGGQAFASLSDVGLALKLHGDDHAELVATPGAARLTYAEGHPASKTYVVVPAAMLEDRDALRNWILRSVTNRKPAAKRRPRKE